MGEVGFEPTLPEREEVLKTYALDHSATHPKTLLQILIFNMYMSCNTQNFSTERRSTNLATASIAIVHNCADGGRVRDAQLLVAGICASSHR